MCVQRSPGIVSTPPSKTILLLHNVQPIKIFWTKKGFCSGVSPAQALPSTIKGLLVTLLDHCNPMSSVFCSFSPARPQAEVPFSPLCSDSLRFCVRLDVMSRQGLADSFLPAPAALHIFNTGLLAQLLSLNLGILGPPQYGPNLSPHSCSPPHQSYQDSCARTNLISPKFSDHTALLLKVWFKGQ